MKIRYLASYHEVSTSQPLRDAMGQLICFTTLQPNGKYSAVLTREQWDLLRTTKWCSPVLDGGFLIPDVDFQAEDGTIFSNLDECLVHDLPQLTKAAHEDSTSQEHARIESLILTAVSGGSIHTKDLCDILAVGGEVIKAVVKASKFLIWRGPRVALAETTTY